MLSVHDSVVYLVVNTIWQTHKIIRYSIEAQTHVHTERERDTHICFIVPQRTSISTNMYSICVNSYSRMNTLWNILLAHTYKFKAPNCVLQLVDEWSVWVCMLYNTKERNEKEKKRLLFVMPICQSGALLLRWSTTYSFFICAICLPQSNKSIPFKRLLKITFIILVLERKTLIRIRDRDREKK